MSGVGQVGKVSTLEKKTKIKHLKIDLCLGLVLGKEFAKKGQAQSSRTHFHKNLVNCVTQVVSHWNALKLDEVTQCILEIHFSKCVVGKFSWLPQPFSRSMLLLKLLATSTTTQTVT